MAKVTINGEVFEFDLARKPMDEALAIENALKTPYAQYEQGLAEGSARSLAGFIWLVWRRNGREVPLADILSGAAPIDLAALEIEGEEGEADPTSAAPAASSTTGGGTSASSPTSLGSGPGRSGSSARTSSKT